MIVEELYVKRGLRIYATMLPSSGFSVAHWTDDQSFQYIFFVFHLQILSYCWEKLKTKDQSSNPNRKQIKQKSSSSSPSHQ